MMENQRKVTDMPNAEKTYKVPAIKKTRWNGLFAVVAENEQLQVTIAPSLGSRIVSIYSKVKDIELLRTPASMDAYYEAPMLYGVPVLFPPNRIEHGSFSYNGQQYSFHINDEETGSHAHGLVHDRDWTLREMCVNGFVACVSTEFLSWEHPEVLRQFPHEFRLKMNIWLKEDFIFQEVEIWNRSSSPFPWGLGYHTTFEFPFSKASGSEQCKFYANVGKRWELNQRFLPTGKLLETELSKQLSAGINLSGIQLDDVYMRDDTLSNQVMLEDLQAGIKLYYKADPYFHHWVLHNGDGQSNFICPEPYTCVTNAFNMSLPHELTGLNIIKPNECKVARTRFRVELLQEKNK